MQGYLYVDGESHYCMAEKVWKRLHGESADLSTVTANPLFAAARSGGIQHDAACKFFWDPVVANNAGILWPFRTRAVYFTTYTGSREGLHAAQVRIREAGFEPQVILEEKDLSKRRENARRKDALLIKAKGLDVALAVRILEDAYRGNYDTCALLTSDIDYLPVIETVRRMGKHVHVAGYPDGLAKDSPFLYVPERFIDIGEDFMRQQYVLKA